jgi:hypothetical protein
MLLLPARCYYDELKLFRAEHAAFTSDAAIFGRQSGPYSTSKTEALQRIVRRSSTLHLRQVVRPRRRRSG